MTELSQKERLIFEYISDCLEKNGYAPTVRDICSALGIKSTSSVHDYLRRLETKGYIKKSSGKSRALSIESGAGMEPEKMKKIPILGRVAAGIPILAIENYDGFKWYEGYDYCLSGVVILDFVDAAEKYSGVDVSGIREELVKKRAWYYETYKSGDE